MNAREELRAALVEAQPRLNAATQGRWDVCTNRHPETGGRPWGWIGGPFDRSTAVTWSGSRGKGRADVDLIVFAVNQQQRAIDHGLDVLERHPATTGGWALDWQSSTPEQRAAVRSGARPPGVEAIIRCGGDHLGDVLADDCPEIAGQHRVWCP